MGRQVVLEYPIRELAEYDEEYDSIGTVNDVLRETEKACLVQVWGREVWFPRYKLRLEDDVLYCERTTYQEKKRDNR